ncbi:SpoIIIAC/SpoIIIAD family protein [Ruminococcus gauvreauii]|uniref:Stage III sporulation AC/AD family protein n=1 Tax=Ruminococcus gauvreauii TaxID=438033 RepID=A0ABY5VIT1_9FIRM|nr:SpoIIIAC/SpoIIIAD family protein [Ruminococcus gauvreauii]UWP59886.1 stage III sporulation AC/AD family protein [Ruminococcus gauvreauii]
MDIIKISILGFSGMILGILLKECKPEYSFYISFACGLCILLLATSKVSYLVESLQKIQSNLPVDASYLNILLKMIGLTYIGQFSSSLCKDAGYGAIASQIEIFCKLSLMVISMPVLLTLLDVIQGFLA